MSADCGSGSADDGRDGGGDLCNWRAVKRRNRVCDWAGGQRGEHTAFLISRKIIISWEEKLTSRL